MYSDEWLRLGYKNGGPIEIINNDGYQNTKSLLSVDYKIWIDNRERIIGVSVAFAFHQSLDSYEIKYDKIAFYDIE
jgi:hypothetical protein